MDTRVALFSTIGNGDIVDYIMLWVRNMQKSMAMIARRAFRGIFLGPVLATRLGDVNIYGWDRTRYPLQYFGDRGFEGGRIRIPSVNDNVWFNRLNQMLRVTQTSNTNLAMTTPTFTRDWHTLDERKIWQSNPSGLADSLGRGPGGRGPTGPGGLPDSRQWGMGGVFTAIQNPRFFGPGY